MDSVVVGKLHKPPSCLHCATTDEAHGTQTRALETVAWALATMGVVVVCLPPMLPHGTSPWGGGDCYRGAFEAAAAAAQDLTTVVGPLQGPLWGYPSPHA
jgi:hypothetical protein